MRLDPTVERYRVRAGFFGSKIGEKRGAFYLPGPCGMELKVIAGDEDQEEEIFWEHVSVSCRNRTPNWTEMCYVKNLFFAPDEVVMQLHPAKDNYVNIHDYVLHMWKPTRETIPLPPKVAV